MTKKEKYIAVQYVARRLMKENEYRHKAERSNCRDTYVKSANIEFYAAQGVAMVLKEIYPNASKVLGQMRQEIYNRFGIETERIKYYADKLQ